MGRSYNFKLIVKTLAVLLALTMFVGIGGTVFAAGPIPAGISYRDQTVFKADKGAKISINIENADIRDVLSLFATKLDVNIVYLGGSFTTSFSISEVDATTAFEIFMKSTGISGTALSYIRDGDLLLVGPAASLATAFTEMLVFASFELDYMTADDLSDYLAMLGIAVNSFTVNDQDDMLFVQGFPYEVAKVNEVINMLDNEAFYPDGSGAFNLVPYKMNYISASTLDDVMGQLGIAADTIILASSPDTLWVNGDTEQHDVITQLKGKLDTAANVSDNEFGVYRLKYINIELVNKAMSDLGLWTTAEGESGMVTVIPNTVLSEDPYAILVNFKYIDKEMVDFLIAELDTPSNRPEDPAFFIYTFENMSAETALGRIEAFGAKKAFESDEVDFKEFSFSGLGKQIMVLCTKSEESAVRSFLDEIDTPGDTMIVVVDTNGGDLQARTRLIDRIPLISYISGVPEDHFKVSGDVSKSSSPLYVMWVEDTPENIDKVKAAIANIDSGN